MLRILVKSEDQSMTSHWEGQAGAAEKNIFFVYYSNQVAEYVCLFLKLLTYLPFSYMYN